MGKHELDIRPVTNAVRRLEEGLARYQLNLDDDQLRDGLIQRFEFTYEICHKMLKRYLKATSATPGSFDEMTFQDLIRSGNERGLLKGSWEQWKVYRDMRARTSHSYAELVALSVVEMIPDFLEEARFLEQRMLSEPE